MADPIKPQSGPPMMRYSSAGSEIASGSLEKVRGKEGQQALNELWCGFDAVEKSPDTTPDEKMLAQLGKNISTSTGSTGSKRSGLYANTKITEALADPLPGPLAPVISKILLAATDGEVKPGDVQNIQNVLWYGLDTMKKSRDLTNEEKQRVNLALAVTSSAISPSNVITGRRLLLASIVASVPGPAGPIIASVSQDAVKDMAAKDAANLLWYSLDTIMNDPGASQEARELADFGKRFSTSSMEEGSVNRARNAVMKILEKPVNDPMAQLFARAAVDASQGASVKDSTNIFWYGLDAIAKHKASTAEQKALAALGMSYSSSSMSPEALASSRSVIAKVLEQPIVEQMPVLISKTALETTQGVKGVKDKVNIQWYGLDAIGNCAGCDAARVALVNLGKSFSTTGMKQESVILARDAVMKAMADMEPKSVVNTIASLALDVLGGITDPKEMNNFLWYCFEAIKKAPGSTDEHRSMASRGTSNSGAGVKEQAQARKKIMEEIALSADPIQEVRDMARNLAKEGDPGTVGVEDDFVVIDGLKLEIKKGADAQ